MCQTPPCQLTHPLRLGQLGEIKEKLQDWLSVAKTKKPLMKMLKEENYERGVRIKQVITDHLEDMKDSILVLEREIDSWV
jgi:Mg2+ and Co2+ transporter CorA